MLTNKYVDIYINGMYLCNKSYNDIIKYNIGDINFYLSKEYYNCYTILLKDVNSNIIKDSDFKKMIKTGICMINVYIV